jgi:hypothetical protein
MTPGEGACQDFLDFKSLSSSCTVDPYSTCLSQLTYMVDLSSVTQQIHSLGLIVTLFGASDKTTVGRVADIRVGRITSLSLLVLSHPRRENAGRHSHLRHWSCWMRTLNGTHIPQVMILTGTIAVWWDTGYWNHTDSLIQFCWPKNRT